MVLPETTIGSAEGGAPPREIHGWDQDSPPLDAASFIWGTPPWGGSTQDGFVSFQTGAHAKAHFTSPTGEIWTRSTYSIHPNASYPIFVVRDDFKGSSPPASKVFTLNLMAKGEVETPAGNMLPPLRTYNHQWHRNQSKKELPSAGKVFPLTPGLNRLGFTGQWLIDWDLYVHATSAQQAHIGNWGHSWHPATEQEQFQKANGREFEERQHILRIKGNGPFRVLILPHRKGEKRDQLQVRQEGSMTIIATKDELTAVADAHYFHRDSRQRILTTFSSEPAQGDGIRTAGGPVEIIVQEQRATVTLHGTSGMRRITLPGRWSIADARALRVAPVFRAGEWLLNYPGGQPVTVTLSGRS
jgi:hypothetical protein